MAKLNILIGITLLFCIQHAYSREAAPAPVRPVVTPSEATTIQENVAAYRKEVTDFAGKFDDEKLTKEDVKKIIERLEAIKKILQSFVSQIESLIEGNEGNPLLVTILQSILQSIKDLCAKIEEELKKWNCLLKKICLQNDIANLEVRYQRFYNAVQNSKKRFCNKQPFNKRCISTLQKYKSMLTQLKNEIIKKINILNGMDCLSALEKKTCMSRLVKLLAKVEGLIQDIKKCLKKIFQDKIAQMNNIKTSLIRKIAAAKLLAQNAITKQQLQNIIKLMTGYQAELQRLKKDFAFVTDCFKKIAKCLTPEDYEKCKQALDSLKMELNGLCKIVRDCLDKLKKKLKVLCLQMEIEKKKQKIEELNKKFQSLFTGFSFDCDKFKQILNSLKQLQKELEACKEKLKSLYQDLDQLKECPDEYKKLKAEIDALQVQIVRLCGSVTRMVDFFELLIRFFCPIITGLPDELSR